MPLIAPTKDQWNAFVAANAADGGLLQSWEWGELERAEGRTIHRLAWGDPSSHKASKDTDINVVALLAERPLHFGWKYIYCPRGPVVKISNLKSQISNVIDELAAFAKQRRAVFLRVEPTSALTSEILALSRVEGANLKSVKSIQPSKTLRIDLRHTEDELLAAMHQKTRYNIRLAERSGVTVSHSAFSIQHSAFDEFFQLLKETTARDQFRGHTAKHYQLLLQHLNARLYLAEHDGDIIAGAIIAHFGTTAYYLHGASANEKRNVMAPYLLHWSVMRDAKARGATIYDLWGVDADRWPGVSRFKIGFAPHQPITEYPGTFDVPISKLTYALYSLTRFQK